MIGAVEENLAARSLFFVESVAQRFVHDDRGRLVPGAGASAATVPRFYLGRAPGLTFWRFAATLDSERVIQLARLAALERTLPGEFMSRIEMPPPPERLPALGARLGRGDAAPLRFRGPLLAFESVTPEGRLPGKAQVRPLAASSRRAGKPRRRPGGCGPGGRDLSFAALLARLGRGMRGGNRSDRTGPGVRPGRVAGLVRDDPTSGRGSAGATAMVRPGCSWIGTIGWRELRRRGVRIRLTPENDRGQSVQL